VSSGIIQAPLQELCAPKPRAHGLGDSVLLVHPVVEHQVGDESPTDPAAAITMAEDRAVASGAEDREDPLKRAVAQGAAGRGNVDVFHAKVMNQVRLIHEAWFHRIAQVDNDIGARLFEGLQMPRAGCPPVKRFGRI